MKIKITLKAGAEIFSHVKKDALFSRNRIVYKVNSIGKGPKFRIHLKRVSKIGPPKADIRAKAFLEKLSSGEWIKL